MMQESHGREDIVMGNQKWAGGSPILMISPRIEIRDNEWSINNLPINRNALPAAWARKYLTAASASWVFEEDDINGTNDRRLISRPSHAINHDGALIDMSVPAISVKVNIVWNGKREIIED